MTVPELKQFIALTPDLSMVTVTTKKKDQLIEIVLNYFKNK
jgi:hypothetical protein